MDTDGVIQVEANLKEPLEPLNNGHPSPLFRDMLRGSHQSMNLNAQLHQYAEEEDDDL